MTRRLAFFSALMATTMSILSANELPNNDNDDASFEVEPPLLIPNRDLEKSSDANAKATPAPIVDLAQLEKNLARAKRNAAGSERLFKIGAIAKVEAEQRALRVVRLQSDVENARLALAKDELAQLQGHASAAEISDAEMALAHAIEAANAATAKRERAELDAAESNLHRQQKLLALGSARTSDVNRAEQKLAELKSAKE